MLRALPLHPRPSQEVMVNVGDLGQDLEHCLKLRWRLREFRGTSTGVRGPCWVELAMHPSLKIQLRAGKECGL